MIKGLERNFIRFLKYGVGSNEIKKLEDEKSFNPIFQPFKLSTRRRNKAHLSYLKLV